jgi:hypothetical protein
MHHNLPEKKIAETLKVSPTMEVWEQVGEKKVYLSSLMMKVPDHVYVLG